MKAWEIHGKWGKCPKVELWADPGRIEQEGFAVLVAENRDLPHPHSNDLPLPHGLFLAVTRD